MESFLRKSFLEYYESHKDEFQVCVYINSMFKKPRYYYTVYYNLLSKHLIFEGYSKMPGEDARESFLMMDDSECTIGEFVMERMKFAYESSDVRMLSFQGIDIPTSDESFLSKQLVECKDETVWINN